ncbi:hypothetical protein [Shewanella halifaxensis]|uniref:hypothetical protein n=1 Tax=Shewanella halifaxensis TaxID=271098 RepID=UPI000D5A1C30|nr:hypothetical protein [Shewanella halifaxensis]
MTKAKQLNLNPHEVATDKYDIAILETPFILNGREINAAIRVAPVIIRTRIEGTSWSKNNFGKEIGDAVLAYSSSVTLRFGSLQGDFKLTEDGHIDIDVKEDGSMNIGVTDPIQIAPDVLIDNVLYGDFIRLAYLMGKTQRSCGLKSENSQELPTP